MNTSDGVVARSTAHLRALWTADRPAFGLWNQLPDPSAAELLASTPFDYVCIDLQHGPVTFGELPGMIRALRGSGRAPVVRVPWNEPPAIMRVLDTGASAVLVPMVNSADDARRAAAACRYPPAGVRSWGPMWGDVRADGARSPEEQDASVICLVMVETRAGLDALDEIVEVPGIDGIYVGPNDLALGCGYGRAAYRDSVEVEAMIQRIITACRDAGVVAGLHCSDPEMAVHWAGRGARMLTAAQDTSLLREAALAAWDVVADGTGRG